MTPRCPRCNQFLPLLGVHRCPCWEYNREPQPTRIGHWATWLVASSLAFTGLLVVAGNAAPRTGPAVVPTQSGASGRGMVGPESLSGISAPSPVAALPSASLLVSAPVPTPPETDTEPVIRGIASHMGDSPDAGPGYLALPIGPGHRVWLCGVAGCLVVVSNDAGPALFMQRRGRVADLSWELFERLTGLDRSRGLAPISWRELP